LSFLVFFLLGAAGHSTYASVYNYYTLQEFDAIDTIYAGNDPTADVCGNFGKFACNGLYTSQHYVQGGSTAESTRAIARMRAADAFVNEISTQVPKSDAAIYFSQCVDMVTGIKNGAMPYGSVESECAENKALKSLAALYRAGFAVKKIRWVANPLDKRIEMVYGNLKRNLAPVTTVSAASDPCNILSFYSDIFCKAVDEDKQQYDEGVDCYPKTVRMYGSPEIVCRAVETVRAHGLEETTPFVAESCAAYMHSFKTAEDCLDATDSIWHEPSSVFAQSRGHKTSDRAANVLSAAEDAINSVQTRMKSLDQSGIGDDVSKITIEPLDATRYRDLSSPGFSIYLGSSFVNSYTGVNLHFFDLILAEKSTLVDSAPSSWSVYPEYDLQSKTLFLPTIGMTEWSVELDPPSRGRVAYLVSRTILERLQTVPHSSPAHARILSYAECLGLKKASPVDTVDAVANRLAVEISTEISNMRDTKTIYVDKLGKVYWSMQSVMGVASMMCTIKETTEDQSAVPSFLQLSQSDISLTTVGMHAAYGCSKSKRSCRL